MTEHRFVIMSDSPIEFLAPELMDTLRDLVEMGCTMVDGFDAGYPSEEFNKALARRTGLYMDINKHPERIAAVRKALSE